MAKVLYFSDVNGETVELTRIQPLDNAKFATMFPGVKGRKYDGYARMVGQPVDFKPVWTGSAYSQDLRPVTRAITYKSNPSKHVCNAKCMGAKCNGACECSCGGKNHGVAQFNCEGA
jgi:hypothetical protein